MDPKEEEITEGTDSTHSADGDETKPAPDMHHPHAPISTHAASSTDEADVAMGDEDVEDDEIDEEEDEDEDIEEEPKVEAV